MSLIQQIKSDHLVCRKHRYLVKSRILGTLIGEAEMIGKNEGNRVSTNEEVLVVIKKFLKNIREVLKLAEDNPGMSNRPAWDENFILEQYLPQQLSETELSDIIYKFYISFPVEQRDNKITGKIMGHLKENYNGLYDGALASKIILHWRGETLFV